MEEDHRTTGRAVSHSPRSTASPSTAVTTPDQSPGADDDIWDTSPDPPAPPDTPHHDGIDRDSTAAPPPRALLSDVPLVRRQHMTAGYREGLAVGKARVMQRGFDGGYPFGVEIGLRVGAILGVLQGVVASLEKPPPPSGRGSEPDMATPNVTSDPTAADLDFVRRLLARARHDLQITELLNGLDDEKIAGLVPGHAATAQDPEDPPPVLVTGLTTVESDHPTESVSPGLPAEIEHVLSHWDNIVLTAFRPDASS